MKCFYVCLIFITNINRDCDLICWLMLFIHFKVRELIHEWSGHKSKFFEQLDRLNTGITEIMFILNVCTQQFLFEFLLKIDFLRVSLDKKIRTNKFRSLKCENWNNISKLLVIKSKFNRKNLKKYQNLPKNQGGFNRAYRHATALLETLGTLISQYFEFVFFAIAWIIQKIW